MINAWVLSALGLDIAMLFMAAVWWVAKKMNNAGYGDPAWFFSFVLVVAFFAVLGPGNLERKALIVAMAGLWAARLGAYLLLRVMRKHPLEDEKYQELRVMFPKRPWFMFLAFYFMQAVIVGLLCVPFAISCANPAELIHPLEWVAVLLWLIAVIGEAVADAQLDAFRRKPESAGLVCRTGLWKYSRHPNYFFECLVWIAFALFATGTPGGWVAIYCPILMILLLTKVTGIPANETQALKTRGEAYRVYQKEVSPLVPFWKKG